MRNLIECQQWLICVSVSQTKQLSDKWMVVRMDFLRVEWSGVAVPRGKHRQTMTQSVLNTLDLCELISQAPVEASGSFLS